ncbi:MAG: class I SAM-dependent methyltransferase [Bryobacteraceae bacterium]
MTPEEQAARRAERKSNPALAVLQSTGLYHSFRLPDGSILEGANSLERLERRAASYPIPVELRGKAVLDIGPWDGFFTFDMERRGASVTAIDYVDLDSFRAIAALMNSRARYERMEVYQLDPGVHGTFDYVLFLGVLYHLKHPLLALEKVCAVTRDLCVVETHVANAVEWSRGETRTYPWIDIYEYDELGGQLDNWCGPSIEAVQALIRMAGFASAELLDVCDNAVRFAARRHWQHLPPNTATPVRLHGLSSHWNRGRSFRSDREEYLALWCEWAGEAPPITSVYPEIGGFGVAPLSAAMRPEGLLVSVRLPPGLPAGSHAARLKIGEHGWSNAVEFHVDLPAIPAPVTLAGIDDGVTWQHDQVEWEHGGWMTLWASGLTPEADPGNTYVEIDGIPHDPAAVSHGQGQINVRLRPIIGPGEHTAAIIHRGARSASRRFRVTGGPPPVLPTPTPR